MATSFALDLVLCVVLIPPIGLAGAAIASSVALVFESASLFLVAKYRLGFHCFVFGGPQGTLESTAMTIRAAADPAPGVALEDAAGAIAKARRATLADRYAANSFTVEWRALTDA